MICFSKLCYCFACRFFSYIALCWFLNYCFFQPTPRTPKWKGLAYVACARLTWSPGALGRCNQTPQLKATRGRKDFFSWCVLLWVSHRESQRGNSNRSHGETQLAGLFSVACSACYSYNLGPLAQGWHCLLWVRSSPVNQSLSRKMSP